MKWYLIVLAGLVGLASTENAVETTEYQFSCAELNSQEEIDLDKIMNKWYIVQVIEHRINPEKPVSRAHVVIDSCPIIKLRPYEHASLKMLWTEEAGNLEYTFHIPDPNHRPGKWITTSLQNGTLAQKHYTQFTGSVHVMKAVASDMVLTFCASPPSRQLYSLLLAREHILEKSGVRGVHNLLRRRGLDIISVRETCVHGGAASRSAAFNLIAWTSVVWVLASSGLISRSWQ